MILFATITAIVLIILLACLLLPQRTAQEDRLEAAEFGNLLPIHCQHFRHVSQLLQDEDERFVADRAPREVARKWRAQRRSILRKYLRGLHDDFSRLERLARMLAALSPEFQKRREWEWLRMEGQFRVLYGALVLKIVAGRMHSDELAQLTNLVGGFAAEMQAKISSLAGANPSPLEVTFGG